MRSLIFGCSSALLLLAAPASAAELVTTSDTDFEPASVVIVSPEDGSVFDGSPDVVVPVTIEYDGFGALAVSLSVDDAPSVTCPEAPPCTIETTLSPGIHKLKAVGDDGVTQVDTHEITIEVKDTGSATESDTDTDTGSPTEATSSPTSGAEPATDTDASDTDPTDGESDGSNSGSGDKEGCGCKATPGAPDLLGLALLALFAPWRRRRHA
ncbi:MYXO-CTERM sorting domain-containing protein [Nannocystis sp. ILAH1]|uniref:MYXO-CTERM sorting domain-containing protein n=1 Tax=unclassified Nannocystis TaxID=2627009 RepID=UPI0022720C70|nr:MULTISPECIES: MYXO-CTERM sorting domain-containing protein [unclassified Nannocystis]MCY0988852.1 MYXO-CTERM sorting domain-containing protein [Nannocystis sp. ILAH1]MCY1072722.1 MYXO-CTERM sorting domain-containing protein [Nannocystis sp. RBIL2]